MAHSSPTTPRRDGTGGVENAQSVTSSVLMHFQNLLAPPSLRLT